MWKPHCVANVMQEKTGLLAKNGSRCRWLILIRGSQSISLLRASSTDSRPFSSLVPDLNAYRETQVPQVVRICLPLQEPTRDTGSIPGSGRSSGGRGNPLQYSCPGESHGQRNLVGYSPWGCKESDMTEHASTCMETQKYH